MTTRPSGRSGGRRIRFAVGLPGENRGGIVRAVRVTTNTRRGNQLALYSAGSSAEIELPLPERESRSAAAANTG